MSTTINSIMQDYIKRGRAKGIPDKKALETIGNAKGGQTIFVETSYMGKRGRIVSVDNNTEESAEHHLECQRSRRWYILACI